MAMTAGGSKGIKNDINVTPLVDVVLVLLIIFMVVTPMLQRGRDVHLPKATQTDDDKQQPDAHILTYKHGKKIRLDSLEVADAQEEQRMPKKREDTPNKRD